MEDVKNTVNHLGVILDGNRRFAKNKGESSWKGHEAGAETFQKFLDWVKELEIKEITAYVLSTENLKRDPLELKHLFNLFKKWFKDFKKDKRIHKNKVKISFIGNLSLVPKDIKELAEEIQEDTKNYDDYKINFCFAYGGRSELVSAFNKLRKDKPKGEVTEQDITHALWLQSEPEMIIRTGRIERTSNFLPWQSIYSEWIFLDKLWPDLEKQDLEKAIEEFKSRKRNYGK
jgi:tritrans,polycis-undecaprenyl-diphosphate synthase [geranylgeranyl-diphosphate specific]